MHLFSRVSLFYSCSLIGSNKHKHAVSHNSAAPATHSDCTALSVYVCVPVSTCKCRLIVLLIFPFILSPYASSMLRGCQFVHLQVCFYLLSLLFSAPPLSVVPSLFPSAHAFLSVDTSVSVSLSVPLSLAMSIISLSFSQHSLHIAKLYITETTVKFKSPLNG